MTFGVYSNNIIGYRRPFCKEQFSGSDDKETFEQNLRDQPSDWPFRTLNFNYTRNLLGHRSKNIDELDNNYLLFVGCSLTEGIGLPVEYAYPALIAKGLGVDYYNMALGGTGPDVLYHNLHQFTKLGIRKPKLVLIQWPEPLRYSHLIEDKNKRILNYIDSALPNLPIVNQGAWSLSDEEMLERDNEAMKEFPEIVYRVRRLLNDVGYRFLDYQPFRGIHFGRKYNVELTLNGRVSIVDTARDLIHPGIKTHKDFARFVINKIERDRLI